MYHSVVRCTVAFMYKSPESVSRKFINKFISNIYFIIDNVLVLVQPIVEKTAFYGTSMKLAIKEEEINISDFR